MAPPTGSDPTGCRDAGIPEEQSAAAEAEQATCASLMEWAVRLGTGTSDAYFTAARPGPEAATVTSHRPMPRWRTRDSPSDNLGQSHDSHTPASRDPGFGTSSVLRAVKGKQSVSRRLELVRLLDRHVPSQDEVAALRMMRAHAREPADVLSAYTYDPGHFTVSAFVTDPEVTRLLLVAHSRVGAWLQPGGHIEPDDANLLAAVRREVAEETGIGRLDPAEPPLFDVDVHRVPAHGGQPSHRHFDLRFHFTAEPAALAPPPDADAVVWSPMERVSELTADRSVLRTLAKLQAQRL